MASSEPNRRTMRSANVTSDVRAHIDRKQNERGWTSVGGWGRGVEKYGWANKARMRKRRLLYVKMFYKSTHLSTNE